MKNELYQKLSNIDLNLLPILMVLIQTRSTQETAEVVGRTQSAVSHALRRMRLTLGDPLFVRNGTHLEPTPLLRSLEAPLLQLLNHTSSFLDYGVDFNPSASERTVVIGSFDLGLALSQAIATRIKKVAPRISIRLDDAENAEKRLLSGELDLALIFYTQTQNSAIDSVPLGEAQWCFFAGAGAKLSPSPSLHEWQSQSHVQVYFGGDDRAPVDDYLEQNKLSRNIGLRVNSFLEALYFVKTSHYFFTSFQKLVTPVAQAFGVHEYPLPFALPPAPIYLQSRSTEFDPFSRWLVSEAEAAGHEFLSKE